jgi:hypothetical protein
MQAPHLLWQLVVRPEVIQPRIWECTQLVLAQVQLLRRRGATWRVAGVQTEAEKSKQKLRTYWQVLSVKEFDLFLSGSV